jgi:hypothetical protein
MFAHATSRRLTAWLAAMLVLLGALLPVLSHAVVARTAGDPAWIEVCTVSGMAWVRSADSANPDADPPAPVSGAPMAACEWCATHTPLAGVPLQSAPPLPLIESVALQPAAVHPATVPARAWASAPPRAPPLSL